MTTKEQQQAISDFETCFKRETQKAINSEKDISDDIIATELKRKHNVKKDLIAIKNAQEHFKRVKRTNLKCPL